MEFAAESSNSFSFSHECQEDFLEVSLGDTTLFCYSEEEIEGVDQDSWKVSNTNVLRESKSHTWKLPNFKASLDANLDCEDGDGMQAPIRTFLIEYESPGLVFLLDLYLSQKIDVNSNIGQQNKNSVQEDVVGESGKMRGDILFEVKVRFRGSEHNILTQFRVFLITSSYKEIASKCSEIFLQNTGHIGTNALTIGWDMLDSRLKMEDSLLVTFHHYVYRDLVEWGLEPTECEIVEKLVASGIDKTALTPKNINCINEILAKCKKARLSGVVEYLRSCK